MESTPIQLQVTREDILKTLQKVIGVVKEKQTLNILSNVLLTVVDNRISITGSDTEVELKGEADLVNAGALKNLSMTLPGRKLAEICKALPEMAPIELYQDSSQVILRSGNSRFTLSTLPADDFPCIEQDASETQFSIPQNHLRELLQQTASFIAQQDVRHYLNGLLLTVIDNQLVAVATDGHRLAKSHIPLDQAASEASFSAIVPRKGVLELMRLLADDPTPVSLTIGNNHISVQNASFSFVSRLIEGKFPNFERVIPSSAQLKTTINRDTLKEALQRVMILCSEKYKAIRFEFRQNCLKVLANNPQQESAEDSIAISFDGEDVDIGFNIKYLLDMLNTMAPGPMAISFNNAEQSVLFESAAENASAKNNAISLYVIMPMRL